VKVLDHEPSAWFLLEEDGTLYLDAHCSHGPVDYDVLVALNPMEASAYKNEGRAYLDQLAYDIHYSAPGAIGSTSPFKSRNLAVGQGGEKKRVLVAVEAWRAGRSDRP
jgi:hypothetical protein